MLITKLGQHQIILGKPWMKKHGVILDMQNDRISFWPGHYQHDVALRPCAAEPQAEPHAEKPCVEDPPSHAEEPHASRPITILKQTPKELPELLSYLLPSTRSVSKVTSTSTLERRSTPQKKKPESIPPKLKPNAKEETKVKDETNLKNEKPSVEQADNNKPLDLAFIGGAPFFCLAKSKKPKHRAEIFAILMRDIEY